MTLYVDGREAASCTNTGVPSSNNFQVLSLGCTHGTIGPPPGGVEPPIWFFRGWIDEPAMWNVALDAGALETVYRRGVDTAMPGLVGAWNFEDGRGQSIADRSTSGNDGFLGTGDAADAADPTRIELASPGALQDGTALRLDRDAADPETVALSWEPGCVASTQDYAIYAGSLGDFATHSPAVCSTGGAFDQLLHDVQNGSYYLVVPHDTEHEGDYGTDSSGTQRPAAWNPCEPRALASSCPG